MSYWDTQANPKGVFDLPGVTVDENTALCLDMIEKWVAPGFGGVFVDIGSGIGRLINPLAAKHDKAFFIGVDVSAAMIDVARKNARGVLSNVVFDLTDGINLQVGKLIAGAWSILVYQHLDTAQAQRYTRQVIKNLDVGGRFIVQFVEGDTSVQHGEHSYERTLWDLLSWFPQHSSRLVTVERGIGHESWTWVVVERI